MAGPERNPLDAAMERYARGDDRAFEEVYRLLGARLHAFCVRLTRRRSEADDLFQETCLKLHRSRGTYTPNAAVLYWAFAIARSVHVDRLRYRKRRPEAVPETEGDLRTYDQAEGTVASPEAQARARQLMSLVDQTLAALPENQRTAYVLLREEGTSVADAAEVLGATPTAVKLRAHRAYEAIREAVRAAGLAPGSLGKDPGDEP
jgi:RNA polymerase sigma-70 factor (ECF subfamily)